MPRITQSVYGACNSYRAAALHFPLDIGPNFGGTQLYFKILRLASRHIIWNYKVCSNLFLLKVIVQSCMVIKKRLPIFLMGSPVMDPQTPL